MAGIIGNMTAQAELTNEFFGTMQGNFDFGMGIECEGWRRHS